MAIILIKIDTVTKTTETLYEPSDLSEVARFSPEYIISFVCEYFGIEKLSLKGTGVYSQARIIASLLLHELLSLSNTHVCKIIGYSLNRNSANIVSRNKKLVLVDKDAILYPIYQQIKTRLWKTLAS